MSTQKIKVFVRCRPLSETETKSIVNILPENNEIRILEKQNFYFDKVFEPEASQQDVFKTVVCPMLEQVVIGFNCTIFAYGQTGTGKTYTMEGIKDDKLNQGIIPRAVGQLFYDLQNQERKFTIQVSFLELYNEDAYDLLSPMDDSTKLKIYDDAYRKGSVIVGGLKEIVVKSSQDIIDILEQGSAKRQKAATLLNACSSRSHTIFTMTINIREGSLQGDDIIKVGKLNLVDLAGSENIGRSGAQDMRAREAGGINQSLLTLGRVMTALSENRPHIPYRESKLTRLLQDSLGGRTKTSLIATISPSHQDYDNTINVLEYASRAKNITNNPEVNQRTSKTSTTESERLRKEMEILQDRHLQEINEIEYKIRNEVAHEFKREIEKMKKAYDERIFNMQRDFKSEIEEKNLELEKLEEEMASKTSRLEECNRILEERHRILEERHRSLGEQNRSLGEQNRSLEEQNRSLGEQNRSLGEQNRSLEEQNRSLEERTRSLEERSRILEERNRSLEERNRTLEEQNNGLEKRNRSPEEPIKQEKRSKVRAKVPDNEDSYANLTFDEDEIAVPSAKKTRINGRKKVINPITLSGKKKKLPQVDEILELSPNPVRVTRSRATKRKLNF